MYTYAYSNTINFRYKTLRFWDEKSRGVEGEDVLSQDWRQAWPIYNQG